ncbi:cytidine diphosphate-diacylglycerol synthase, putative [Plasmodium ovale]|uniref:Phosphatidate cytidylyltransferase n=1 Tax=Plasmodium ovale TaxID=36330 RepID=A0A1D3TMW7_PLAOA|nr:cytidine diphosphate-diacylglycerol synthase, putative [Plasmodium ovale]
MQKRNVKNRKGSKSICGSSSTENNEEEKKKKKNSKDTSDIETSKSSVQTRSKSKSLDSQTECAEEVEKLKNYNDTACKKKKNSNGDINGVSEVMEEWNNGKNSQKYDCKKRKSLKDMKYNKEIKQIREYTNLKNANNKLVNINVSYGSNRGLYNGSKHRTSNSSQGNYNSAVSQENSKTKMQIFKVRLYWSLVIVFISSFILAMGHFYLSLLVLIAVTAVYREIISLKSIENKDRKLPQIFYIRWYWFFLTILTIGIPWIIPKLKHQISFFNYLLKYHSINMFVLAFVGFVWFILSLRKFSLKYQFSQIGIILITSLFVVTQSLMHIANIYSGLIWFILPVSTVAINDSFAYIFGILFGRTRLIKLSPKKTVEGFLGSSVITILWGIAVTYHLQSYHFFICPQNYISFIPFYTLVKAECEYNSIFQQKVYTLPVEVSTYLPINKIYYTKMVLHALVLSLFAAFLAPFGGFFASGFKRALKIKDFGQSIPGHGGFTDRLDCQVFIGMFTYLYLKTFVKIKGRVNYSYDVLIDSIQKLDNKEVLRLFNQLKNIIDKKRRRNPDKNKDQPKIPIQETTPISDNK